VAASISHKQTIRPIAPDFDPLESPFRAAPEVLEWVNAAIISETGAIHNPDHGHLEHADLRFLWAAQGFTKRKRTVIGQAEKVAFRSSGWQRWREEQPYRDWFGLHIPEFVITLDASYCSRCSDAEFCALVEHELYHIAQDTDEFGALRFRRDTGLPVLCMRGHDVEEFVGVVRRYGATGAAAALASAALSKPQVSQVAISTACGTCLAAAA
jgi:hypothetical protein